MENATKALLMAAGVLIAILIISMFVLVLQKTGSISKTYDSTVSAEEITIFNSNFTQYVGRDNLTIHDVITICNFAKDNNVKKVTVTNEKTVDNINNDTINTKYKLIINNYDDNGYISKISFMEET